MAADAASDRIAEFTPRDWKLARRHALGNTQVWSDVVRPAPNATTMVNRP